jgi:ribokinase
MGGAGPIGSAPFDVGGAPVFRSCTLVPVRVAVIGHVEWVEFAPVDRVPAPGEIAHASATWEEPAGGGGVAVVQLLKLAGAATLFTALGDDDLGHRAKEELERLGARVAACFRSEKQRRAFTFVDAKGERTITTIGKRLEPRGDDPLPWAELDGADAVYFTAGDQGALRAGRKARVLVATSRVLNEVAGAKVSIDALVGSARDPAERYTPGALDPPPRLVVATRGADGGEFQEAGGTRGTFPAAPVPGPVADAYGCGDSFAAGLAFGLGAGLDVPEALALAARCGAAELAGRGAFAGQLTLSETERALLKRSLRPDQPGLGSARRRHP